MSIWVQEFNPFKTAKHPCRMLRNSGTFEMTSAKWPRFSIGHKNAQFELGIF
jgi:hypothetical protein